MSEPNAAPQAPEDGARSLKLYELTDEYTALKALLEATEGDATGTALSEALVALSGAITQKAEGIAKVYLAQNASADWVDSQADIFEAEANRLRDRAYRQRKATQRLTDYLAMELAALGEDTQKFVTPLVTITLSKRPAKDNVVVVDEDALPDNYKEATLRMPRSHVPPERVEYITAVTIRKADLNAHVEATGILPPGCATEAGKRTLKIY